MIRKILRRANRHDLPPHQCGRIEGAVTIVTIPVLAVMFVLTRTSKALERKLDAFLERLEDHLDGGHR